jgi:alpha-ketoglutarate-dependent taurine dioxygenase
MEKTNVNEANLELIDGMRLLLNVETQGIKSVDWARQNQAEVAQLLKTNGALLIRGLKVASSKQFGQLLEIFFDQPLMPYVYRSTPRTEVRNNVFTATEYPADQVIQQHNENAYSRQWPDRIGFLCLLPSQSGGETPISDSNAVYNALPEVIREKFARLQVLYVRNYSDIDLPWSEVFQTTDKAEVERFCQQNDMQYQWLDNNELRTRQINPAVMKHPVSGEMLWFNQAHLFHVSALAPELRETLEQSLGEDLLPRNTYYGDGSPIEPEVLATIHSAYETAKVRFQWQKNDLLLLDNLQFGHGREAYEGARKVLTGMTKQAGES